MIDAVAHAARHTAGTAMLPARDLVVLAAWAVGGLVAAVSVFQWEPYGPTQRRVTPLGASH